MGRLAAGGGRSQAVSDSQGSSKRAGISICCCQQRETPYQLDTSQPADLESYLDSDLDPEPGASLDSDITSSLALALDPPSRFPITEAGNDWDIFVPAGIKE